jgi:hypothetical protein
MRAVRAGLVVVIGLALVLGMVLWSTERAPATLVEPPRDESMAVDPRAHAALQALAPAVTEASVVEEESPAASREPEGSSAAPIQGQFVENDCGRPIGSGVRVWIAPEGGSGEIVDPDAGGRFTSLRQFPKGRVRFKILEARSGDELHAFTKDFDPASPQTTWRFDLGLLVPLEIVMPGASCSATCARHGSTRGPSVRTTESG